jgi:hypothetical protein
VLKTLFVTVFTLLTWSIPGYSQILVGPVIGGQLGWASFEDKENKDLYSISPKLSWHAGASVAFRVQKRFFLQTSVLYSQKSKMIDGKIEKYFYNETKFNYIDVPILYTAEFKAKLGRDKVYKYYIGVGPTVSYWLGGKGVLRHDDLNENGINPNKGYTLPYTITFNKKPEDVKQGEMNVEDPNRLQLGLNISTGIIFEPMGIHKIMVSTRYEFGHTLMSRTSKGYFGIPSLLSYEDNLRVHNNTLVLSLHYFLDLKTEEKNKGKSTIKPKKKYH